MKFLWLLFCYLIPFRIDVGSLDPNVPVNTNYRRRFLLYQRCFHFEQFVFFITEKVEVLSTLRWTVELHECFPYVLMAKRLLFVTYYNVQVFLSLTNGCQLNGFYMQHPSNLDMHLIKLHPLSGVNKFCLMNSNYWTTRSAS